MNQSYFMPEKFRSRGINSLKSSVSAESRSSDASSQVSEYLWGSYKRSCVQRRNDDALLRDAIAVIISETIQKLEIVASVIDAEVEPSWIKLDFCKPPAQRFTEMSECQDDKYNDIKRCKRYACLFRETLKTCLDEMVDHGTLNTIGKVVRRFRRQDRDEKLLHQEHAENKKRLEEMTRALTNAKDGERLNDNANEVHKIREAYEEKHAFSLLELKYVNAYEEDRCYLKNFSQDVVEQKLRRELDNYSLKISNESRVHLEMEEYLEDYVMQTEKETRDWVNKCDADEERLDQEILETKQRKYKLELQHLNLRQEYQQHCRKISEWLTRREIIREDGEEFRLRNNAAITIQAWWKGELQRRRLGPFSDKTKKKKKTGRAKAKGKNGPVGRSKKLRLRK